MSLKRIRNILESVGLSPLESKVYIYIAKKGPSTEQVISLELGISKQQLYPILSSLKEKGIAVTASECFNIFSVSSFEDILEKYIEENVSVAKEIIDGKQEIIDSWREMNK